MAQLIGVPASVFNTVGVTSPVVQVTAPIPVKGQPTLTGKSSTGKAVPEILYVGAEYCPFCAAQRWSTIIALSRFGTWSGLGNMASYAHDDVSQHADLHLLQGRSSSRSTSSFRASRSTPTSTTPLRATTTAAAEALEGPTGVLREVRHAEVHPGSYATEGDPIPFISIDNKFLVSGASYSPDTLDRTSRARAIATGLTRPDESGHRRDHRVGELPDRGNLLAHQATARQRVHQLRSHGRQDGHEA